MVEPGKDNMELTNRGEQLEEEEEDRIEETSFNEDDSELDGADAKWHKSRPNVKLNIKKYKIIQDPNKGETSFGGENERSPLSQPDSPPLSYRREQVRVWYRIRSIFQDVDGDAHNKLEAHEFVDRSIGVREKESSPYEFTLIIDSNGEIIAPIPSIFNKLLGKPFSTKLLKNARLNEEARGEQDRLREENIKDQNAFDRAYREATFSKHPKAQKRVMAKGERMYNRFGETQKLIRGREIEIDRLQKEIDNRNLEDMETIKKLPIRPKIKEIFRKYGWTTKSIILAIWAVSATIVAIIESTALANKPGSTSIGSTSIKSTRINKSIPAEPIINFIWGIALEIIGDLADHSFLLIGALVIFYIDPAKPRLRREN